MRRRQEQGRWRAWCVAAVLAGVGVAGCGGSDEGTHVQVDRAKEDAVTKAMGEYMQKQQAAKKGGRAARH